MPIYSQAGFDFDLQQVNATVCSILPLLSGIGTVIDMLEPREKSDHLRQDFPFVPTSLKMLLYWRT